MINPFDPRQWRRVKIPAQRRNRVPEGDDDRSGGRARLDDPRRDQAIFDYAVEKRKEIR